MQVDLAQYDDVVHRIYDAALRPEQWSALVSSIARLLDASHGLLFTWMHKPTQGGFSFTHNLPQSAVEVWAAKSMHEDPFLQVAASRGLLVEGSVFNSADLVAKDVFVETSFYKELWAPVGIGQGCCSVVFDATDAYKLPTALSLFKDLDAPVFTHAQLDVLRRLSAHLSRALGMMFHLRDSAWRVAASEAALERLGSGVVLVDAERKVQFANQRAQSFFVHADTLQLGAVGSATPLKMHLHHRLAQYEGSFQKAIAQALQPLEQDVEAHFSQALLLPAADGRPSCVVHAVPLALSHSFATGGAEVKAIVFLYDLQSALSVEPSLLCKLFGMTHAEARTALQLTLGGGIEQMAARLGVASSTVKTQLQAAYMKSNTGRQADLLKLLLALATR